MRLNILRFIAIYLLLNVPSYAMSLNYVVAQIQKGAIQTTDLTASFIQESTSAYLEKPDIAKGKFYFKKPKKMRWDYETPDKQEVVTDGKTLWIYVEEDRQVYVYDAFPFLDSKLGLSFLSFLSGQANLEESFNISFVEEDCSKDSHFVLKLVPKNPEVDLKELFMWVSKKDFFVDKVRFCDFYGNRTLIILKDVTVNRNISDSKFVFSIPEGVEVIKKSWYQQRTQGNFKQSD